MVEVWEGDEMVAAIYTTDETPRAFRVISKHTLLATPEPRPHSSLPNALRIKIEP